MEQKLNSPKNPPKLMLGFTGGYSTIFDSLIGVEHAASLSLRAHAFFWIRHAGDRRLSVRALMNNLLQTV